MDELTPVLSLQASAEVVHAVTTSSTTAAVTTTAAAAIAAAAVTTSTATAVAAATAVTTTTGATVRVAAFTSARARVSKLAQILLLVMCGVSCPPGIGWETKIDSGSRGSTPSQTTAGSRLSPETNAFDETNKGDKDKSV